MQRLNASHRFRQTQLLHSETLVLKMRIMLMEKQLSHCSARLAPTLRQVSNDVVRVRTSSNALCTDEQWRSFAGQLHGGRSILKASLPLCKARKESGIVYKRPAKVSAKRKPTAFTLKRVSSLKTAGVKKKPARKS